MRFFLFSSSVGEQGAFPGTAKHQDAGWAQALCNIREVQAVKGESRLSSGRTVSLRNGTHALAAPARERECQLIGLLAFIAGVGHDQEPGATLSRDRSGCASCKLAYALFRPGSCVRLNEVGGVDHQDI